MNRTELGELLKEGLVESYSNLPKGKYITLVIEHVTESECIFRTEGSGEGLNKELVKMGLKIEKLDYRAIISKRKQSSVERRTGREILRDNDLLFKDSKQNLCELNKNSPCGKCLDCMLYGYAVGDGGAQKSRVIYDNAYSIRKFIDITDKKTFNVLYENGTMRDEKGKPSSSINEDEYIKPNTIFLDMITLKDITVDELIYILGCILRSKRYGALSSRIGKINNKLLNIIVSDCEMFSNLELTQGVYDKLSEQKILDNLTNDNIIKSVVYETLEELSKGIYGSVHIINNVEEILNYIKEVFSNKGNLKELLENQSKAYGE